MIAAIFVVPLVYFINAFLIGRLIKRIKIDINPFLATIVGFVAFFDIIYIVTIWMYAGQSVIWTYFVVIGIIQTILLALYIANWRYIFITWSINWKKIITFVITFGLTVLIGWLCFRDFNSEFGKTWIWTINHSQVDIWRPMWFGTTATDVVSNFSTCNVMNLFWLDAFSVILKSEAIQFCNWSWTIIAAGFVACLSTWMFGKNCSFSRLVLNVFIVLLFVTLTLAFIESYAVGDAWILLLLFAYVLVMIKQEESRQIKLFCLTTLLMGFLAFSCTSFFTVICVWLFSIYYGIRYKQNSLNYALFLSWPLALTIFSMLSIYTFWLLSLVDAIYLVFAIILLIVWKQLGTPAWETKLALNVSKNSNKIVYAFLAIIIALFLVANFFIFQEIYHWQATNIDYHNFLTFTYTYLWTIDLTSSISVGVFNAVMYALFLAFVITYLVIRRLKNNMFYPLCRNDSAIKLGVISIALFINPLVIHVLKISTTAFPLNTLDLNMLFVVPIFVFSLKAIHNYKKISIRNWKYNWY